MFPVWNVMSKAAVNILIQFLYKYFIDTCFHCSYVNTHDWSCRLLGKV